jgi:prepilin signal peptidase PulO-like enzyme (type II secretory pathway)
MDVYGARQGALQKKYMKILWQHAKDWFKLPKIIATIALFYFFYLGLIAFGDSFALSVLGVVITFGLAKHIILLRKVKKRQGIKV